MKKLVLLILSIAILICLFACNNEQSQKPTPEHTHSFGEWFVTKNPTCNIDGMKTRYCECGEKQSANIPATGEHTVSIDSAVAPSCTETGLTEGEHCSKCDEIIIPQTVIEAKGHTVVVDKAVAPSCTQTGLTEGQHCSACNEVLVKQGIVPVVSHSYDDKYDDSCNVCGAIRDTECAHRELEVVPGYASTCTEPGLTQGQKCKKCGEVITHQTVINAKGHTEVVDEAIAATCTESGLTAGKHCSTCNTILIKQGIVPTLPHTYGEWVVTKNPNCGQDGEMARYCTCGAKQTEVISGAGMHTEITDHAVDPTCATTGLTEGKHCSYCGTILVQQEVIPTLDHIYNTTYSFDNSFHWYACQGCGLAKDKAEHQVADDGMCTVCDQPIGPTVGIVYDISADGTYAEVIGYEGTSKNVKISDTYNGLPVRKICKKTFYQNQVITNVVIPNSIINIGNEAFYGCESLTSIVIPDSVIDLGVNTFESCTSLESVIIGDGVVSIAYQNFYACYNLKSVIIGDSVRDIGWNAFGDCRNLTSIVMGENVQTINEEAFNYSDKIIYSEYGKCKYLGTKTNPYFALIDTTNDNYSSYEIHPDTKLIAECAFLYCERWLGAVIIPDGVRSINSYAFSNCSQITSIEISNNAIIVGEGVFQFCDNLKFNEYNGGKYLGNEEKPYVVLIRNENKYNLQIHTDTKTIASEALTNTYIDTLVIPDGVEIIGGSSFTSLHSVVIPNSVTSIGYLGVESVYYAGTKEEWDALDKVDFYESVNVYYNYIP